MTFETWAKELLCKELKNQGVITYIRKPHHLQGWYCATPNGFLLHVEPEKTSFGYFRINYEIMPLIGRIIEPSIDLPRIPDVTMCSVRDADYDYIGKFNYSFDHPCISLKTRSIGENVTDQTVVDIIRDYLNPLFDSLTSYENYCKAAIETKLFYVERNIEKRKELAQGLFDHGYNIGIDPPAHYQDNYPTDYPWFADNISQMPYVYAFLGKHEEVLAKIRGVRQFRINLLENSRARGEYIYRMEQYLGEKHRLENEKHEIEEALQEGNTAYIHEILLENYRRNRDFIYKCIGLKIPKEYSMDKTQQRDTGHSKTGDGSKPLKKW